MHLAQMLRGEGEIEGDRAEKLMTGVSTACRGLGERLIRGLRDKTMKQSKPRSEQT
jgi:hypothetical protein